AALVVAGAAADLRDGVAQAAESIDSGKAKEKIKALARITQEAA
ncbi:MAG: anthranilate phosphoribosyltransferase, partial [Pseudomonadota bacterium]